MATVVSYRSRRRRSRTSLDAFERIYRDNVDAILGFFARGYRDPQTVADLTAETFMTAVRTFASFDPRDETASAWLTRIAGEVLTAGGPRTPAAHRPLDGDEVEELAQRIEAEQPGVHGG